MTTANEILAAELGLDDDIWFEVDLDARVIRIPSNVTNLGVKSDENVKKVKFRLPSIYHDTDLRQFKIGVDYTNANGEPDRYEPEDIAIDDGMITFTWVVGRHAAIYNGSVTFSLCLKRTEGDEVVQELHTTDAHLPILDGTETCELAIVEHTDLLEQWREQLWGAGDSVIENINKTAEEQKAAVAKSGTDQISAVEAKGAELLKDIPENWIEAHNTANQALRTRANAIVNSASGKQVIANDSSDDYLRGLRIFGKSTQIHTTGKNLLEVTLTQAVTRNGVTFTPKFTADGQLLYIVANGTATDLAYVTVNPTVALPDGTYILSGCPAGGSTTTYDVRFNGLNARDYGTGGEFTIAADSVQNSVTCVVASGVTVKDLIFYPMIRVASIEDASYEPYSGGIPSPSPEYPQTIESVVDPSVDISSGNLFNFHGITDTSTIKRNADGSLTVTLYASPTGKTLAQLAPSLKAGKRYTIHLDTESTSKFVYLLNTKFTWYTGTTVTITDELLTDRVYVYGVNGDAPIIIRNIAIVPEGVEYNNESYVPTQTLTLNRTLPGIPVTSGSNYTDANGQQWICDEIDFKRGIFINRVGTKVFDGSDDEIWYDDPLVLDNTVMFRIQISDSVNVGNVVGTDYLCSNFPVKNMYNADVEGTQHTMQQFYFRIAKATLTTADLAGFKAYLAESPMTVTYVLKTPIETALTDGELYHFTQLYTNYPTTIVSNDHDAHMIVEYNADTEKYINNHIVPTSVHLTDIVTGTKYKLYVVDGKLKMEESEV